MGVTMSMLSRLDAGARTRWLLLMSVALNVLFVGAAGAVALRYTGSVPLAAVARIGHNPTDRLNQIAASLPSSDAQVIRAELRTDEQKVAAAQADLRLAREDLRNSLRADPFSADAMRAAMEENRLARDNFDLVLHDVIATAATKMSVVGRNMLADWPTMREKSTTVQ
jgi:uncharacterized membrane protein